ncbi:MAG: DUF998 domain-containing protein [Candidatus Nanopelagicales bacterium]
MSAAPTQPWRTRLGRRSALVAAVGSCGYWVLTIELGLAWPGSDPVRDTQSELGAVDSPIRWVMNVAGFMGLAVSILAFAAAYGLTLRDGWRCRIAVGAITLASGPLIAAEALPHTNGMLSEPGCGRHWSGWRPSRSACAGSLRRDAGSAGNTVVHSGRHHSGRFRRGCAYAGGVSRGEWSRMGSAEVSGARRSRPARYVVRAIPTERLVVLDWLARASRRYTVHGLVEFDVTLARSRIAAADPPVSWTGFVVATMARAVASHPEVNARRAGRRVLCFDRVDIGATVEREVDGEVLLGAFSIEAADAKSCAEITAELRRAKASRLPWPVRGPLARQAARLPDPIRRMDFEVAGTRPGVAAGLGPAVGVTSLGMFSRGGGGPFRSHR